MSLEPTVRRASNADRDRLGSFARLLDVVGAVLLVNESGTETFVAAIDPGGCPTEPMTPCLEFSHPTPEGETLGALIRTAIAAIGEADAASEAGSGVGGSRLIARCDPLDYPLLSGLEAFGFRLTSTPPYREIGGGQVHYISGYEDAAGGLVDLELDVGPGTGG